MSVSEVPINNNKKTYKLTPYPLGSVAEMWTIAWPLMLGLLSSSIMMFADRFFLARYSVQALTGAASAGTAVYAFLILPMTVTGITEVFVGQYHGHDKQHRMGEFTWQMLWFALFALPVFALIAHFFPSILFYGTGNEEFETPYFKIISYFGCFQFASQALTGYFAGQGRVKVITMAAIFSNIVNIFLDYIFIFGWKQIPSMGISGAAYGTGIAMVCQWLFFMCFFLAKKDRENFGTTRFSFRPKDFFRCIKIGLPAGVSHLSETLVHFAFFRLMILAGPFYIIIASMIQSFYLLVLFLVEGLSKAVVAIASNLIGASFYQPLMRVLFAAFRLQVIFGIFFAAVCYFFSDTMLKALIGGQDVYLLNDSHFVELFKNTLFWLTCFFFLDGLVWAMIGFLTAAGDTRFVMLVGVVVQWLVYFTPVFVGVMFFGIGVDRAWMLIACNSLFLAFVYYMRIKHERWKMIKI